MSGRGIPVEADLGHGGGRGGVGDSVYRQMAVAETADRGHDRESRVAAPR
jgi:hypothetical protein